MKLKYKQDYIRCHGGDCEKKDTCLRYDAYNEAKDKNRAYGKYIDAKVCIETGYKLYEK